MGGALPVEVTADDPLTERAVGEALEDGLREGEEDEGQGGDEAAKDDHGVGGDLAGEDAGDGGEDEDEDAVDGVGASGAFAAFDAELAFEEGGQDAVHDAEDDFEKADDCEEDEQAVKAWMLEQHGEEMGGFFDRAHHGERLRMSGVACVFAGGFALAEEEEDGEHEELDAGADGEEDTLDAVVAAEEVDGGAAAAALLDAVEDEVSGHEAEIEQGIEDGEGDAALLGGAELARGGHEHGGAEGLSHGHGDEACGEGQPGLGDGDHDEARQHGEGDADGESAAKADGIGDASGEQGAAGHEEAEEQVAVLGFGIGQAAVFHEVGDHDDHHDFVAGDAEELEAEGDPESGGGVFEIGDGVEADAEGGPADDAACDDTEGELGHGHPADGPAEEGEDGPAQDGLL